MKSIKDIVKQGEMVTFKTVIDREEGIGTYENTHPITGSYLVKNVTMKGGVEADYVWAESMSVRSKQMQINRLIK